MNEADVVFFILVAGATLYAIFGGADFGAGVWQLLSFRDGAERRASVQARIGHSLGPVWEANHVWLIFALVVLWTAFGEAFGAIMRTLYLPLALAALGIVLRGSGFAFGHVFTGKRQQRAENVFALSSLITPFFMGTVVGAIASGEVRAGESAGAFEAWTGPLPLLIGVLFVVSCAYIASIFLLDECRRANDDDLATYFSRRAIGAAVVAGALAAVGLLALRSDARYVYDGLFAEGLPFVIASALLGVVTLLGLVREWPRGLRPLAVGAVVMVIAGWAVAQFPYLLPTTLSVGAGAAPDPTLTATIIVFIAALLIVVPALVFLLWLAQQQTLE